VKPEARAAFEQAVRDWIPRVVQFPGHLGVFMLRPGGGSDEFGVLVRFHSRKAWNDFQSWPPYRQFLADIRPMLAAEPKSEPLHGLEAWFTPNEHPAPPRWKMVLLTWVGVNVMVFVAKWLVGAIGPGWPQAVGFLVTNTIVVIALTWPVMPVLARIARPWLI
jgi:antibiotic biosynthesis monooxygenase (ABM) superfamily enzyme